MDVLKSMTIFQRVAESGSFSAVAKEYGMSQSTVSKHISALEERLDTKLLSRSTRCLSLTEAGNKYYESCTHILEEIDNAETEAGRGRSLPTGTLRVSATATFGRLFIVPFLGEFLAKHENIDIDLILEDRYVDLVKEGIDMAVRVGPMDDSSIIARKIGVSERVIVASPSYIKARGEPKVPEDLQSHDCLIYSRQSIPNEWMVTGPAGVEKLKVVGRLRATQQDAIREAALGGLGIATVMLWSVRDLVNQGKLKIILSDYKPTPFEVHAVYPERNYVPQKVLSLIEHLRISYEERYPLFSALNP